MRTGGLEDEDLWITGQELVDEKTGTWGLEMLTILCKLDYNENPCLSLGNIKKRCVHHLMSHFCKFGWFFFKWFRRSWCLCYRKYEHGTDD